MRPSDETLRAIGIIPARYASTRFPGKPLALLGGKPVIEHVYERAKEVLSQVVVATDDERILQAVNQFGGEAVMTGSHHRSGTDRCFEALQRVEQARGETFDIVVNIQGDEPFIHPRQLTTLLGLFHDYPDTQIATLAIPFNPRDGLPAIENPNSPKVVVGTHSQALYFSRSPIPFLRGKDREEWPALHTFLKHIGLYAYRTDTLALITQLPPSPLEQAESLEQLRWLENGLTIRVGLTDLETIGIDTPADLERAERQLTEQRV